MSSEHTIDGRLVDVKKALPRDKAPGPARSESTKIFVGGLSAEVTDKEFAEHFSKFGLVKDAIVMVDRNTGRSRGFGFVTFESEETVNIVIRSENEIMGKFVEIKRAQPRESRGGEMYDQMNAYPQPNMQYNNMVPYGAVGTGNRGGGRGGMGGGPYNGRGGRGNGYQDFSANNNYMSNPRGGNTGRGGGYNAVNYPSGYGGAANYNNRAMNAYPGYNQQQVVGASPGVNPYYPPTGTGGAVPGNGYGAYPVPNQGGMAPGNSYGVDANYNIQSRVEDSEYSVQGKDMQVAGYSSAAAMQQLRTAQHQQFGYSSQNPTSTPSAMSGYGGAYGVSSGASMIPPGQSQANGAAANANAAGQYANNMNEAQTQYGAYRNQGVQQARVERSYRPY